MCYPTGLHTYPTPITEGKIVFLAGEKGIIRLEWLYLSIYAVCTILYTGLCVTMGASH